MSEESPQHFQTHYPTRYIASSLALIDGAFKSENSFMPNYKPPPIRYRRIRQIVNDDFSISGTATEFADKQARRTHQPSFFATEVETRAQPIRHQKREILPIERQIPVKCVDFSNYVQTSSLPPRNRPNRTSLKSSTLRAYKRGALLKKDRTISFANSPRQSPQPANPGRTKHGWGPRLHQVWYFSRLYNKKLERQRMAQLSESQHENSEFQQLMSEIDNKKVSVLGEWQELLRHKDEGEVIHVSISPNVSAGRQAKAELASSQYKRRTKVTEVQKYPPTKESSFLGSISKEYDENGKCEICIQTEGKGTGIGALIPELA